jgi:hypothetical protein
MDLRQFGFIDPPTEDSLEAAVIALKQVHSSVQFVAHHFVHIVCHL